jgi:phage baseplate assembly protein gpV
MALTEQVEVVSIHGEKLNAHFNGVGHALPLAIDKSCSTIVFQFSDGLRFNRHVPHEQRDDFKVGQTLTQVIS